MKRAPVLMFAAGLLFVGGCDRAHPPVAPVVQAPAAVGSAGIVRLVEWSFKNRGIDAMETALPENFTFEGVNDSVSRNVEWTRADFLAALRGMFVGRPGVSPAQRITFDLDRFLLPTPDNRPGHDARVHGAIRSSMAINVQVAENNNYDITGHLLFFLTRGDSAAIPPELQARGMKADTTRWWIDRLEDETIGSGFHTDPAGKTTFSRLLELYRPKPLASSAARPR
jgi:hypothetical protein